MRIRVLLLSVLLLAVPAFARGTRGGYGHSGSHSYRSYGSHSHYVRSTGSPYRSRSYSGRSYRSRPSYIRQRSYGVPSYHSRGTSTYGGVQRDSHGRIKRSEAAKDAFKRQHPCPSTGRSSSGACPGYVIDHVKPLANGGADAPSNMQWQTKEAAKAKDKWERKR
jgi:hypothetical protein